MSALGDRDIHREVVMEFIKKKRSRGMREVVPMYKITFHRGRLGWSKNKLARVTRLTPGDVGKIESGRLIPYPSQIKKIADAFGVTVENLANEL